MKIDYKIEINKGPKAGATIVITYDLEEIEFDGLPMLLIDAGYLDSWCNEAEFEVLERSVAE